MGSGSKALKGANPKSGVCSGEGTWNDCRARRPEGGTGCPGERCLAASAAQVRSRAGKVVSADGSWGTGRNGQDPGERREVAEGRCRAAGSLPRDYRASPGDRKVNPRTTWRLSRTPPILVWGGRGGQGAQEGRRGPGRSALSRAGTDPRTLEPPPTRQLAGIRPRVFLGTVEKRPCRRFWTPKSSAR